MASDIPSLSETVCQVVTGPDTPLGMSDEERAENLWAYYCEPYLNIECAQGFGCTVKATTPIIPPSARLAVLLIHHMGGHQMYFLIVFASVYGGAVPAVVPGSYSSLERCTAAGEQWVKNGPPRAYPRNFYCIEPPR